MLTTFDHISAVTGAQIQPGEVPCSVEPPAWFRDGDAMGCGPGSMRQCNAVFASSVAVGMAAAGTLTFDCSASNFQRFKAGGIHFFAANLADTDSDHTRGFTATALTFAGTNYLGGTGALNLAFYGVNQAQALSVVDLPELTPGGQDVTMTVQNVNSATNLTLYAWMFGFALR